MSANKLSSALAKLLTEYGNYRGGPPKNQAMYMSRDQKSYWVNQKHREIEEKVKLLISQEAKNFTFPDWYCICAIMQGDIDCCRHLVESAVDPHEVIFALLLTVNNCDFHNNRNCNKFFELIDGLRARYDALASVDRKEFLLLWTLIVSFPTGDRIVSDNGDWVRDFWKSKCNVQKWKPYPL